MLMNLASSTPLAGESLKARLKSATGVFRQVPGTFRLVWQADRRSAIAMAVLTLISAALPAAIAYVGKLIVDAVVTAARTGMATDHRQPQSFILARTATSHAGKRRQRPNSRESALARASTLRGRRRLRQDAERAARSFLAA